MYAYSVACGIVSGVIDYLYLSDINVYKEDLRFSNRQINELIHKLAEKEGYTGKRLPGAINKLEGKYKVLQDNVWSGESIGVSAKNHHLADLAHHPTPAGLMAAIIVQFLRFGIFVNKEGEWHFKFVETTKEDLMEIAIPAIITGTLNWLVYISKNKYEEETGKEVPKAINQLAHLVASTPSIIQVVECANKWFGHLVSDMGGSKQTAGKGMGIPGIFISLLYEISGLPILKDTKLPHIINNIYEKGKIDLRKEYAYFQQLKRQALPVIFNEVLVRLGFMLIQLINEIKENDGLKEVNWNKVIPINNRSLDRCLAISTMTFNVVDTADAAFRAAVESGANWVLFSGKFVARYNFVGAGRATLAIVKEFSNEQKETQLLHERRLLMEEKAQLMFEQLQQFKSKLEEKVSNYLVEDIEAFIEGFDYMKEGIAFGDSNLVIKGNVIIQEVLGREPQFKTQEEFDELMDSDVPVLL